MPISAVQDLVDDHREMSVLLAAFGRALGREDRGAVLQRLDRIWARLAVHIRAEHLVLFETLRRHRPPTGRVGSGELEQSLAQLRADHDRFMRELADAVNLLRRRVRDDPTTTLAPADVEEVRAHVQNVVDGLAAHDRLEEERVYRWLDEFLDEEQRREVGARIRAQLDRLPPRLGG